MDLVVVDTDVVSFGFRQDLQFLDFYGPAILGKDALISFMTYAELQQWTKVRNWGEKRSRDLLAHVTRRYLFVGASEELCEAWADLTTQSRKQGRPLETSDAWIAATALVYNCPLITHNARDFEHLSKLKLVTLKTQ